MMDGACCGHRYCSPAEAIQALRVRLLLSTAIHTGTSIGDELHNMGWNGSSSRHDDSSMNRPN